MTGKKDEIIPRSVKHMNRLESLKVNDDDPKSMTLLQESIELGMTPSRKILARRAWMIVDINTKIHKMSKVEAVQDASVQLNKSEREIYRYLEELNEPLFKVGPFPTINH